ncbi:MAG: ABC transporter ATP-binding protein [Candidatus Paceibacteria bacterium]
MSQERKKNVQVWPVLRAYIVASGKYPFAVTFVVLGTVAALAASIIAPLYLRQFINILSSGDAGAAIVASLFSVLLVYAGINAINWVSRRVQMAAIVYIEARVMADLTNSAFSHLIRHSHDFFISNFAGALTRRVTRYSRAYEQVFDSFVFSFFQTFLFAGGSIYILYTRNMWLGLGLFAWVVLFVTIQIVLTRWRHPIRIARAAEDSRMTGALSDAIGNHSTIALFATENQEESILGSIVHSWQTITLKSWNSNMLTNGIQHALAILVEVGLLGGAIFLWQKGLLTVGDFVLIQVYILGLIDQIWNMGNTLRQLYDAFADASEMVDIIQEPHAIQDSESARPLVLTTGKIEFKDVSFSFIENRPVLEHFSLPINGGEKVALVGPSGAGKSTITSLLFRLYDPKDGAICIDDQDLREVTQESLRSLISFVPQESILFHRTLRDNIRYGKQDATDEEVIAAAQQAHCHEFISALPEGYDTHVGERGVKLSGGERQRVAIARAILKNAPILVLDEATSSLDSESEALIQDALAKLMQGKTVITIAHRLSTVMKMDRIIVLEEGKVALTGTHNELLAQGSNLYKKLWEIQAGGFIDADEEVL